MKELPKKREGSIKKYWIKIGDWIEENFISYKAVKWLLPILIVTMSNSAITDKVKKIETNQDKWLVPLVLSFVAITGVIICVRRIERKYKPSSYNAYLILLALIWWWKQSFLPRTINCISWPCNIECKWLDLILFGFVTILIPYLIWQTKFILTKVKSADTREDSDNDYLVDSYNLEEDLLDRGDEVNIVIKELRKKRKDSFIIGINGEWGSGKTFFLKLLIKELNNKNNKNDNIVIEFNPWKAFAVENGMERELETVIVTEIGKYNGELKSSLMDYFRSVVKSELSFESVKNIFTSIENVLANKSIDYKHKNINKIIEKMNKNIFVFIDDLDRLTHPEIIELIKVIRNTINFKNMNFILAYDRSYLQSALLELKVFKAKEYLEKIINYEYTLRQLSNEMIIDKFIDRLIKIHPEVIEEKKLRIFKIKAINSEYNISLSAHLRNIRQIKKLSFKVNEGIMLFRDLDLLDLFYLELVNTISPEILKDFYIHKEELTVLTENKRNIILNSEIIPTAPLDRLLGLNKDKYNLNEYQLESICKILKTIFKDRHGARGTITEEKLFNYYFLKRVNKRELYKSEFLNILNEKDDDVIEQTIKTWIEFKDDFSVYEEISEFKTHELVSKNECLKRIQIMIIYERIKNVHYENIFDYPDRFGKFVNNDDRITELFDGKFKESLINEFTQKAKYPYLTEIKFYCQANSIIERMMNNKNGEHGVELVLNLEEVKNEINKLLELTRKHLIKFPNEFNINYFWKTVAAIRIAFNIKNTTGVKIIDPVFKSKIIEIVFSSLNIAESLTNTIFYHHKGTNEIVVEPQLSFIFETPEEFVDGLIQKKYHEESKVIKELIDIVSKKPQYFKTGTIIDYSFKHIKVS